MKKFIDKIDISKHIANHVIGDDHTSMHRKTVGLIVMGFGVTLAHMAGHYGNLLFALSGDLIGYSIHAVGSLPFLRDFENSLKKPKQGDQQTKCETC